MCDYCYEDWMDTGDDYYDGGFSIDEDKKQANVL
jgi:hypothetical protein